MRSAADAAAPTGSLSSKRARTETQGTGPLAQSTYNNLDSDLRFTSRRSPVLATRGMVSCSHPLAAEAGLSVLKAGGNAVDAAIAIAAALAVVEPASTGLGGDCFLLFYEAGEKRVHAMNGSGRSPAALTIERLRGDCPDLSPPTKMPPGHAHTVTVPGTAAGWCDALERWGTMELQAVLAAAIRLAEEGFPVSPVIAYHWRQEQRKLEQNDADGRAALMVADVDAPGGLRTPRVGEIFRNPAMARTLRELAVGGKDAFYKGRAAQAIVALLASRGSVMSMADLARHADEGSDFCRPPVSVRYAGMDVYEHGPNSAGLAALLGLRLLDGLQPPLASLEHNSLPYLHRLIEAMRLAFADARWYVADPAISQPPLESLLSEEYNAERRQRIDPNRATADVAKGCPCVGR